MTQLYDPRAEWEWEDAEMHYPETEVATEGPDTRYMVPDEAPPTVDDWDEVPAGEYQPVNDLYDQAQP
jgi:hypothetical protein